MENYKAVKINRLEFHNVGAFRILSKNSDSQQIMQGVSLL